MGSTNKTQNYDLSQYIGNDRMQRADMNNDMLKIDTALKGLEDNKISKTQISTDGTFASNSDELIPSQKATAIYVLAKIAALVNSSPAALDTLNELAVALGNDANFATTMTNALAAKVNINDIPTYLNPAVFPGDIRMYGGATAPAGWLICDGAAISRTTYAALFTVIGISYGAGDGINTFNVPDFRGIFPKGAGLGQTDWHATDYDGGAVGTRKRDQLQSHDHTIYLTWGAAGGNAIAQGGDAGSGNKGNATWDLVGDNTGRFGATTESASVSVNFLIKI